MVLLFIINTTHTVIHFVGTCRQKEVEMEAFQLQAQEVKRYMT